MYVLGNTHAPENDTPVRFRVFPSDGSDCTRIDPADFRHLFWRERSHVLLQVFDAFGEVLDIVFIRQALFDDCVHHRVQEGYIRPALELNHMCGVARQRLTARIHHD